MRYFDLRGLLPQASYPSSEALATFERIPSGDSPAPIETEEAPVKVSPEKLAETIAELERAGVGADRHTCPDLLGQLRAAIENKPDIVICSLLDGDATLRLNAALAARYSDELMAGMEFLDQLLTPKRSAVVMDETAPENWLAPVRAAAKLSQRRVIALRNDYPESDPTLLLFTLLGKRLKPGRLPTKVGAILVDVPAAIALGQFARTGRGPSHTPVAVHHPNWVATRYAEVAVGTPLLEVLNHMGLNGDEYVIRAGDLLRDHKVAMTEMTIARGELTFHVIYPDQAINPDPCIRCGWCVEGCPVRIHPAGLLEASQHDDLKRAHHFGIDSCIECGICTYVCPSRLPLLAGIRHLRGMEVSA